MATTQSATPQGLVADPDEMRRRELSGFLRSRRERLTPLQAGLPANGRRRTPGLRREEVAQLAGVGVTWYTWLEQGRDIKVSTQVLEAISRTLMLDHDERVHLYTLAGSAEVPMGPDCAELTPAVRTMLDQFVPFPACVQNGKYDLLAWNRANLPRYFEVYLRADVDFLATRDPKGLYRKSQRGEISDVVGVDIPWHAPQRADLVIDAAAQTPPDRLAFDVVRAIPDMTGMLRSEARQS